MEQASTLGVATQERTQPKAPRSHRRRLLRWAAGALSIVLGGGLYQRLSARPTTTRYRCRIGLRNGPLRIAALSDLHLDDRHQESYDWLLQRLDAEAPDVVVFVGDTVDSRHSLPLLSLLAQIEAPGGKFATLGNWEYATGVTMETLRDGYVDAGVRLLVNESVDVDGLHLVGLDDWREGRPEPALVGAAVDRGPTLALTHCPIVFEDIADGVRADSGGRLVVLSGHTHGGQIAPLGCALFTPSGSGRYVSGWYEKNRARLYVMRGFGFSTVPVRLGPRPELTILDLL